MNLSTDLYIRAILKDAFGSRWIVVMLFILVNAAALTAGMLGPKKYTSSVSILYDDRNIVAPLMQGAAVPTEVAGRARNVREVIFGRSLMDRILEEGGWMKDQPTPADQERQIEEIKKRIGISSAGRNIIKIEYSDDNPERAFRITEKLAEMFIQESIVEKSGESKAAFDFIEQQAEVYHEKLVRTEEQLKELRSANLDARAGTEGEVTARINSLQTNLERTRQELREAEIQAAALEKQVSGEIETTAIVTRESQFRARMAEIQSRLDTLRLSYHDAHPDIVQLKEQMRDLTGQINAERERRELGRPNGSGSSGAATMNNPIYQQLRRQLTDTQLKIESLKARIVHSQEQLQREAARGRLLHASDARLAELTREYQVNRDIFQDLVRRRENARVSMNLDREQQGPTFKIQEPATLPAHPSGLRFLHFVLGGLVLGIAVPLGLIAARLYVDPRIRIASTIVTRSKVAVAAVVPHMWTPRRRRVLRLELAVLMLLVVSTVAASGTLSYLRAMKLL